jgi:plastocyanin
MGIHARFGVVVIAASVLACSACGGGGNGGGGDGGGYGGGGTESGSTTTVDGMTAADHGTKDVSGESKIELEADDYYFEPTILEGKPGQKLTLEVENEGEAEHNLTIDKQGIDKDVAAGEKATVEVTFPASGTVAFYCKYHTSEHMAGALKITG